MTPNLPITAATRNVGASMIVGSKTWSVKHSPRARAALRATASALKLPAFTMRATAPTAMVASQFKIDGNEIDPLCDGYLGAALSTQQGWQSRLRPAAPRCHLGRIEREETSR